MSEVSRNVRESNFELLCLFSMFIIVFYHLLLTPNQAITNAFYVVLHIAVPCFILISGYFGINASVKNLLNLFLKCAGYAVCLYTAYCIVKHNAISVKELIKSFLAFSHTPGLWFITIYVFMYIFSPIINIPLKTATTKQKLLYITLLGFITFWFGWVNNFWTLQDGKNITNFIFLYYIGNFLRYNIDKNKVKEKRHFLIIAYLSLNIILFVTLCLTGKFMFFQKLVVKVFLPYNSPGVILNAILCFLVFSTFDIKSKWINRLASSALAIYLIHSNTYFFSLLHKVIGCFYQTTNNYIVFLFVLMFFALIVSIGCIFVDKLIEPIRNCIWNIIYNALKLNKIDGWLKETSAKSAV